jgi:hypothetical protein
MTPKPVWSTGIAARGAKVYICFPYPIEEL